MRLVGLGVHARQTHTPLLDPVTIRSRPAHRDRVPRPPGAGLRASRVYRAEALRYQ
jgi:hypothetical protein